MKIILTGSEGNVGSRLKLALQKKGYELVCIQFDLSNQENYSQLEIRDNYIVIHLAGEKRERADLLIKNNIVATSNVVRQLCLSDRCKGLIYFSSIAAFGLVDEIITEESERHPDTLYGLSKKICEDIIYGFLNKKSYIILRPTNVVTNNSSSIVWNIVNTALLGNTFEAWKTSLVTKRDYVWIEDVIEVVGRSIELLFSEANKIQMSINIASGHSYSLDEIIQKVEKVTKKNIKIKIVENKGFRAKDLKVSAKLVEKLLDRSLKDLDTTILLMSRETFK